MDAAVALKKVQAELADLKANSERSVLQQIAKRDALAKQISVQFGTFDHADKTLDEVVKYGCQKAGVKAPVGQEAAALDGYLHARSTVLPPAQASAMDAAVGGKDNFVTRHLGGK